jgi:membrane protease YdiL (CAAX protease family)
VDFARDEMEPMMTGERRPATWTRIFCALAEVVSLLAIAHVACRAFKHFTPLGHAEVAAKLNFSPGWTMALVAVALLLVCRRNLADYGLAFRQWPGEARHAIDRLAARSRLAAPWWWAIFLLQFAGCLVVGLANRPAWDLLLLVAWQFLATAPGEEIFFRGYVQSRLDQVFPRNFNLRRVRFGAGLILTALLFGLLHSFNTVDYFSGRFTFAWTLAGSTAAMGLFYGWLKERTGSIVPGIALHALTNLYWFTVMPPGAWFWLSRPGLTP